MADMDLIFGFVQEARDYIDEVEPTLIEILESSDASGEVDQELINGVFRLFHSMKGSAGFLNLNTIAAVTHEAETLLDKIRKGKMSLTVDITTILCKTLDLFRNMLDRIEVQGEDTGFEEEAKVMVCALADATAGKTPVLDDASGSQTESAQAPAADTQTFDDEEESLPEGFFIDEPEQDDFPHVEITDDMRKGYVMEALEQLENTEQALLQLEDENAGRGEALQEAFRGIHSFKGNSGFMGFADPERLSHKMETTLDCMRNNEVGLEGNVAVLLSLLDVLKEAVSSIDGGSDGSIPSCEVYINLIDEMLPESHKQAPKPKAKQPKQVTPAPQTAPSASAPKPSAPKPGTATQKPSATASADTPSAPKSSPPATSDETLSTDNTKIPAEPQTQEDKAVERARRSARQDIRVDLQKLDTLINLVGELVIAETMVTGCPAVSLVEDEYYDRAKHQLRRICGDLQDIAMSVRMIPLSATFRRMVRLVHDLSHKSGKKIRLNIIGEDTEVDKTVIEQIADPLVHIVRNSCDHGLEMPVDREAAGKPDTGTVTLEGRHEGGEVWIMIHDDGRGLNREKILAKAIERGLLPDDGREIPDERIFRTIFEPGFSTADQITDVSGRGVGMDVVKKNIEKLNGRIDIRSNPGHGSTFILRIPLTLAIIDGMLVRVGDSQYTVPTLSIRESLRPQRKHITITPEGKEVLRLREELIPVIRLHELFDRTPDERELENGILIVAEDANMPVAIFVDEILGQQQTVIKGLSDYIGKARGCSGCTILGDGAVSLILDVGSLVSMAEDMVAGLAG